MIQKFLLCLLNLLIAMLMLKNFDFNNFLQLIKIF